MTEDVKLHRQAPVSALVRAGRSRMLDEVPLHDTFTEKEREEAAGYLYIGLALTCLISLLSLAYMLVHHELRGVGAELKRNRFLVGVSTCTPHRARRNSTVCRGAVSAYLNPF